MFFHRRPLRRWAVRVLLAWLFGVVAGVANACIVTGGDDAVAPRAAQAHQHGDQEDTDQAACHDFCAKSSVSVRGVVPGFDQTDLPQGIALPASFASPLQVDSAPLRAIPPPGRRRSAPPIPIAFLRLAL